MTWFGGAQAGLDLYHVGLVVPDLDAAVQQYGDLLGFTWSRRSESRFDVRVDGVAREARIRATYSTQGPPHLELVEDLSGIWSAAGLGLSHVGFWTPALAEAVERAEAAGLRGRVHDDGPDGRAALFSYHELSGGFWMELVSTAFAPRLAARLAAGSD